MTDESTFEPSPKRVRKMAREPEVIDQNVAQQAEGGATHTEPPPPKPPSKTSLILGMLQQAGGTTLKQMVQATGWLPHTTRAALTGLRKKGHAIERSKVDGETRYAITLAAAE